MMRVKKTTGILLMLALLHAAVHLPAFVGEGQSAGEPREVEITGRVRLVGTSRFPSLVITGDGRDWFIEEGEQEKLMELQQQTVTVRGREYAYNVYFANGLVSRRQYVLKNITVVRVGG